MDVSADDIFGDLLKSSTQPRAATTYHVSDLNPSKEGFNLSIQPQSALKSSVYHTESAITSLLHSKNWTSLAYLQDEKFCYVLVDKNDYMSIQVYHLPDHPTISHPVLFHSFNTSLSSSLFQDDDNDDSEDKEYRCLYALHQRVSSRESHHESALSNMESASSGNIDLPQSLFVYLFGQETACLNFTVLLICGRNGDVFAYSIQSATYGKLQLFCSLRVPVIGVVSALALEEEPHGDDDQKAKNKILDSIRTSLESRLGDTNVMGNGSKDGLLLVGRSGECCLFVQPPSPNVTIPASILLPDPVVACVTIGKCFLYSSGTSVKACKTLLCQTEKRCSFSFKTHLLLDQVNIRDLQLRNFEEKQECHLLGITSEFDAVNIAVFNNSSEGDFTDFDSLTAVEPDSGDQPVATCLREALSRLKRHTDSRKALQKKSLHLDSILLQMNLFATISQQLNISKLNQQSNSTQLGGVVESCEVLECVCELVPPKKEHMLWELRIKLVNRSSVSFSNDWSVIVTENPVFGSSLSHYFNSPMAKSFQYRLDNCLEAKSDIEFAVPVVDSLWFDYLLELEVSVILILCLESLAKEKPADSGVPKGNVCHLLDVEICRQSFDTLSFLQMALPIHEKKRYFREENSETDDWLCRQLSRMAKSRIGDFDVDTTGLELEKTCFSVSVDIPMGYSEPRTDILLSFLNARTNLSNETSCSLTTPSLQMLSISVDECDDYEPPFYRDFKGRYSLKVKSRDVLMMFCVLEAVRRKIQSRASKDRCTISKEKLEQALQQLKRVHHQMRNNLNVFKFGSEFHPDHMTSFCHFLDKLRCVSTLEHVHWQSIHKDS